MTASTPDPEWTTSGPRQYRLGLDIGGTFTDLALQNIATGQVHVAKSLSTPGDPSVGALRGIALICAQAGVELNAIRQIVHATTHGANIIIEGVGAAVALLVTQGFGDILLMQRQLRHSPYDLMFERHAPLVPRERVWEVPERMRADGSVHRELDEERVRELARELSSLGVEAVAVSLLHSYVNPGHELRVRDLLLEECPGMRLSLSSEVAPVMREYERTNTTVANVYIQPAFEHYLSSLVYELGERGFAGSVLLMQANGGVASLESTLRAPIGVIESGPAAAVAMACACGQELRLGDVLAFDMGGTTAKAGLIVDGEPGLVDVFEVDKQLLRTGTGLPIVVPSVDIIEVGAGGGSIARAEFGIVAVGPSSAGADPGPACYGLGGSRPTVTDANLALGYIDPGYFNGGAMTLDIGAAREALHEHVAAPLGLGDIEAAWGVYEAVTANMENAIRAVSMDRGHDARTLTLIASGGAAPLHALRLARSLGMRRVLIPTLAGVMSAVGLLHCDPQVDLASTYVEMLNAVDVDALRAKMAGLERQARGELETSDLGGECVITTRIDMRYRGQGDAIKVPVSLDGDRDAWRSAARQAFARRYAALYGYTDDRAEIEIVALRLTASGSAPKVRLPEVSGGGTVLVPRGRRDAYFPELDGFVPAPVYRRVDLATDTAIVGPAIIEDPESTVVVPPGDTVTVDPHRHLMVDVIAAPDVVASKRVTTGV